MISGTSHARPEDSVLIHARRDLAILAESMDVSEALAMIRQKGLGERIVYFYVVDDRERLVGVLPTRRLLMSALDRKLSELMIRNVTALPETATVLEACEELVSHKFLALPVIDVEGHLKGVVDIGQFTDHVLNESERSAGNAVFETLGFRLAEVRGASPVRAFRFRFPWLLATIASGSLCAGLTSLFETTLEKSIVLAFFLTLVLGLAESVSMQAMTLTIQALQSAQANLQWYWKAIRRELVVATLLGLSCGTIVAAIVILWRQETLPGLVIGLGIFASLETACFLGVSIPASLHAARLDPKIAAGPVTLALTDLCTLLFYFSFAASLL